MKAVPDNNLAGTVSYEGIDICYQSISHAKNPYPYLNVLSQLQLCRSPDALSSNRLSDGPFNVDSLWKSLAGDFHEK